MKRDTLFFHKEVAMTCKENMGDVNEYQKLLEPPPRPEKTRDSKKSELICG
jgi:hypothetical protein